MTDTQSYTVSVQFRDDAVSDAEYAELISDLEQVDGIAARSVSERSASTHSLRGWQEERC